MAAAAQGFALVTPASRGIGFALAQQLLTQTGLPVVATARKNHDELREKLLTSKGVPSNAEKRLHLLDVDVNDESAISSMAATIRKDLPDTPLRLAFTVPGILHVEKSPTQIDADKALDSFKVNSLGPLLLMKHLSPLLPNKSASGFPDSEGSLKLPAHAIYAMMAARVGSISDNASGGWYSYRASKSAVFQTAKTFDLYLRGRCAERAIAVALHPGTVKTDFTKEFWKGREMLEPLDSADRLLKVVTGLGAGPEDGRGKCWDYKGKEVVP
ncbi:Uncharacterized protein PECH_002604 [Penicillium ucsense]|uniref:Uncharacterized protein n=1 Tax=Penicillium ucsense TaxID=2839758 RepID=A0A8J8WH41_9EURO|nr:Uncharacterized protein PECM_002060 [Penicillium ucsense]KAF7730648.1 Uncharacterized protein PECH_002604 [Penicillium ucsense]